MNLIKYLIFFILFFPLFACNTNENSKKNVNKYEIQTLFIPEKYDEYLNWNSILKEIQLIPLETSSNSLIGEYWQIIVNNEKFYIHDSNNNSLKVFDKNGKYLYKIGCKGKGPGEFIELRDFEIDKNGNIFILDFEKILKFSQDGEFIKTYTANFYNEKPENTSNSLEFALGNNCFYIWAGSENVDGKYFRENKNKFYYIHKVDFNSQILGRFLNSKMVNMVSRPRFFKYEDGYNLGSTEPFNDTIYRITDEGVNAVYKIDFGKNKIPNDYLKMDNKINKQIFEMSNITNYSHDIHTFLETTEWIYFNFGSGSTYVQALYSKKMGKAYVGKVLTLFETYPFLFKCTDGKKFYSIIEPKVAVDILKLIESKQITLPNENNNFIDILKKAKDIDNPILCCFNLK